MKTTRPPWLSNWLQRHQNPASRWLHLIGIPLAIAALLVGGVQLWQWRWDLWWRPAVLLVAGYMLQYAGHRIEGNDVGEVILVKKLLKRPYVAISPRYASSGAGATGSLPASAGITRADKPPVAPDNC